MADRRWPIGNGKWQIANGKWQMADGRWQMADGGGRRTGQGGGWCWPGSHPCPSPIGWERGGGFWGRDPGRCSLLACSGLGSVGSSGRDSDWAGSLGLRSGARSTPGCHAAGFRNAGGSSGAGVPGGLALFNLGLGSKPDLCSFWTGHSAASNPCSSGVRGAQKDCLLFHFLGR